MSKQSKHKAVSEQGMVNRRTLLVAAGAGVFAVAVLAFAVTALLVNVFHRQQEAAQPFFRVVEITDETADPAVWGQNFPLHYDLYIRTTDMERTRFGGSEAMPRTPTDADPRSVVARSQVEEDPRLRIMWAGYPFSVDYRHARGHAYMLEDATFTERHEVQQYGVCLNCHASTYTTFMELGEGDLTRGFEQFNPMLFEEARALVEHPISCIDCHDPETMQLRITRPAFKEGIKVYKASQGIPDYDVNTMATRHEMRSYACAQCHVEYYFAGDERRLTFPWHKGLRADDMLEYFDEIDFTDWVHADTGANMLKVQHPEFELWSQGTHAAAGVTCSDCHMPYKRVGAMKISDHHVRSPLLNINNACQTCHNVQEDELLRRAETIQERTFEMRHLALDAMVHLVEGIIDAQEGNMPEERLELARQYQRSGTFYLDFVEAENSMGFHAPQESARVLLKAIDHFRKGSLALKPPMDAIADPGLIEGVVPRGQEPTLAPYAEDEDFVRTEPIPEEDEDMPEEE